MFCTLQIGENTVSKARWIKLQQGKFTFGIRKNTLSLMWRRWSIGTESLARPCRFFFFSPRTGKTNIRNDSHVWSFSGTGDRLCNFCRRMSAEGIMHHPSKKTDEKVSMHFIIFHCMKWVLLFCSFPLIASRWNGNRVSYFLSFCRCCQSWSYLQNHDHIFWIFPVLSDSLLFA